MNTEYPLSLAEARAALVNEPPGTEIERQSTKWRWRRPTKDNWDIEITGNIKTWTNCCCGPLKDDASYRIIPVGHPDHSEYVAPTVKLLTFKEARLLKSVWVFIEPDNNIEEIETKGAIIHLALYAFDKLGWPIVATREEAEALLKEHG